MKPALLSGLAFCAVLALFVAIFGGATGTTYRDMHPVWPLFAFIVAMIAGALVNTWAEKRAEQEGQE
ncbi:hypothetical protein MRQ47_004447 [Salmonella enterica]|nr:hypothetical protein [Salmonella enterica]